MQDSAELMSRYFDQLLTDSEHQDLQNWLRSSPDHMAEFAKYAILHDRLRGEQMAASLVHPVGATLPQGTPPGRQRSRRSLFFSIGASVAVVALLMLILEFGKSSVAASEELRRLIAAQETEFDRTYRIEVEDTPKRPPDGRRSVRDGRPPKPPLNGAILHVRKGNQFVLIRQMDGGQQFVTGSNGQTSWAVRPVGPVRVSHDLTRFNRDLPGHEHDFPLIEIKRSLTHLQQAYEIQLLPVENDDETNQGSPTRLLVAVKKRGHRGPRRVEIAYAVGTGQIHQLRFIEMPYGPEHLTVRLTEEQNHELGSAFFDHQSHHTLDRVVEEE